MVEYQTFQIDIGYYIINTCQGDKEKISIHVYR